MRTRRTGILSILFGYGTIDLETAGTHSDLTLSMIPNVRHWEQYLLQLHDELEPPEN